MNMKNARVGEWEGLACLKLDPGRRCALPLDDAVHEKLLTGNERVALFVIPHEGLSPPLDRMKQTFTARPLASTGSTP